MSRRITVIQAGPRSTVQDCGRHGYQRFGVSVSGAMDQDALLLGNRLVGNEPCAAAVEVTLGGAAFRFEVDSLVAITGGNLAPSLDGLPMPGWTTVAVPAGGTVTFGGPSGGLRAYLCVAGGVETTPQLGSRSTHVGARLGGLAGDLLHDGDVLPVGEPGTPVIPGTNVPRDVRPAYAAGVIDLRVLPGPQADAFSTAGVRRFFESEFTVTEKSDRQGIRLDGPVIEAATGRYDIVSDAVALGSIQVPGDGKPIILLADRQTTGGYAKIGVVASVDLPLLAQAAPGAKVRFREMDIATAQKLFRARRTELLDATLPSPSIGVDATYTIAGTEYLAKVAPPPTGESAWFTEAELDGRSIRLHVEQRAPREVE